MGKGSWDLSSSVNDKPEPLSDILTNITPNSSGFLINRLFIQPTIMNN